MTAATKTMKTLASALGALCLGAPLAALAQNEPCRTESLKGLYVFSASGHVSIGGAMAPKAIVELIRFNGDGTLSVPGATRSVNGTVASSPPGGTGTYDLGTPYPEQSCWGRLSFAPSGPHFDIFVSPRGDELWMIQTDAGNVFQGRVTKVAQQ
jgi:hypothetical protein